MRKFAFTLCLLFATSISAGDVNQQWEDDSENLEPVVGLQVDPTLWDLDVLFWDPLDTTITYEDVVELVADTVLNELDQ